MAKRNETPITGKAQLVEWFAAGCKDASNLRIGTEHEKIVYRLEDFRRPAHEGERGIGALLDALAGEHGWEKIMEGGETIGLMDSRGGSVTLEPGGQFELSGAPLADLHATCDETARHLKDLRAASEKLRLGMLGIGFDPLWKLDEIPMMPKGRYAIMLRYIPTLGDLGLDIMFRTCTTQVNLDYTSEADMVAKFRASLALQPIATALFANSPFREGGASGLLSTRSIAWSDLDPVRCGFPQAVFAEGFGFEAWVDYLLDLPMFFVYRDGKYIDRAGKSFRDFLAGRLEGFEGQHPTMSDWEDHTTTAFPEVRAKKFLEMRGADCGPWDMICALPALWVGLLYDGEALAAACALAATLDPARLDDLRHDVVRRGLNADAPLRDGGTRKVLEIARQMVGLARDGLARRSRLDKAGNDETGFLDPISQVAESGVTRAEFLLEKFRGEWGGDLTPLYKEYHF